MDFEFWSLVLIIFPPFLSFGAAHFGICFVRRNGLRRALRILAFLPILAAAVLAALDLAILYTAADVTIDYLFGAMLYGIPALFALVGSAAGWLIGRAVKKKRQSLVDVTVL